MAFKIAALKLPFGKGAAQADAAGPSSVMGRPLPILGKMAFNQQLRVLTTLLVVLLLADGAMVAFDAYRGTVSTAYIATVGKIRMLSQRLAKAAQQASQGNREAFK